MDYTKYKHKLPFALKSVKPDVYAAFVEEEQQIYDVFKQDLFNELGIADNPKRDKLFAIAWEYGHSSGYSEVYNYADELVDLIN